MAEITFFHSFRWYDLGDQENLEACREIWRGLKSRRPHDHPDFLFFMLPAGYRPAVAVYRHSPNSLVYYAFCWCELRSNPAFSKYESPLIHLVSPYGYGGAIFEGDESLRDAAAAGFALLMTDELSRRGCVSEFIREDVFDARLVQRDIGQRFLQQLNVVVRLDRSEENIWRGYKQKVRKNVNRAREEKLRIELDRDGSMLDGFLSVYYSTMKRTGAAPSFFIPKERFVALIDSLGRDEGMIFAHIFSGSEIVSTELLLLSADCLYSFLGGTLDHAYNMRPNDLLKHEMILWGASQGYKWYVLGGGVKPDDGIFKYKASFDPESILPFYVRRIVYDEDRYRSLCLQRAEYEKQQGEVWSPRADFFPEYLS